MEFNVEKMKDILPEMKPLIEAHWEEVCWNKGKVKLNPDYEKFFLLQDNNCLLLVTVRDKGKLIGYNINHLHYHLHFKDHIYAVNDSIYLEPKYRHSGIAKDMLEVTEQMLEQIGVSVVTLHMNPDNSYKSLADSCGYSPQELVYSKYIGE